MSVRNTNQTNVLKAKRCESASPDPQSPRGFYRHVTEVTGIVFIIYLKTSKLLRY